MTAATAPRPPESADLLDEEVESLRQIRQALELSPSQRLSPLRNAYSLFLIGQRRRGRAVFEARA